MKPISLFLFLFCDASQFAVFAQRIFQKDIRDKEKLEIRYIIDCIKNNQSVDSLLEWRLSSKYDNNIVYKYKGGRQGYFLIDKNSKGLFLRSIVYYRQSFQKVIFLDDTQTKYEINKQVQFRVWMSKDRPSIYFCMIDGDNIMIWVLSNGNDVYTYHSQ